MRAFIIYVKSNKLSEEYANRVLNSFQKFSGWEPELFVGLTPETLIEFEKEFPIEVKKNSRAEDFQKRNAVVFRYKKSCSMNHYRLMQKCVELNDVIVVPEHDVCCVSDWRNLEFEGVLVLNIESAAKDLRLKGLVRLDEVQEGIHDLAKIMLRKYRHDSRLSEARIMPGTAAYAVTPSTAKKMIEAYETIGWEQSDHIINTAYVPICVLLPEMFGFGSPNLRMSRGENISDDVRTE